MSHTVCQLVGDLQSVCAHDARAGPNTRPGGSKSAQSGIQKAAASLGGCPPLESTDVIVTCRHVIEKLMKGVDCSVKVPLGTKATFKCPTGFTIVELYNMAVCKRGKWDKPMVTCQPITNGLGSGMETTIPSTGGNVTLIPVAPPPPCACDPQNDGFVKRVKFYPIGMNYFDALSVCQMDGSSLVALNTSAQSDTVKSLTGNMKLFDANHAQCVWVAVNNATNTTQVPTATASGLLVSKIPAASYWLSECAMFNLALGARVPIPCNARIPFACEQPA